MGAKAEGLLGGFNSISRYDTNEVEIINRK